MSTADGAADGPPRRRGRRLIGPIALGAAVVLVAALAIWGGGGHTAKGAQRTFHGYPTTPPYPDVPAQPVAAKTKLPVDGPFFGLIQGRVVLQSFRVVAYVRDGRPCFVSDDHTGAIAPVCWPQPTPMGAQIVSMGFGRGVGGITVGVAGPSVLAVSLVDTDGTHRFAPALRLPGTDARVWAALTPVAEPRWTLTALDGNGVVVPSP